MMGTRWWAYILALVLVVLLAPAAPAQFADLIERVRPSVGFILVTLQDGSVFSGSGFVIRSDGYLLSASHVFDGGAKTITVTFPGGRPIPAQVLSRDPKRDMAVLKVEASGLRALPFTSTAPRQGDEVLVFGYPMAGVLGSASVSVTRGIISAFNDRFQMYQIDAAANPGNSGGPALNPRGEIVGMLIGGLREASGVNFLVPFTVLREYAQGVIQGTATAGTPGLPTASDLIASRLVPGTRMGPILIGSSTMVVQTLWGEPEEKDPEGGGAWWGYVTRKVWVFVRDDRITDAYTESPGYRVDGTWGVGSSADDTRRGFGSPPATDPTRTGVWWDYAGRGVSALIVEGKVFAIQIYARR